MADSSIISRAEDSGDLDNGIKNKWNWHWLEKQVTVDVKKVLPSTSWNGESLTYYVGESIRKVKIIKLHN